MNVTRSLARAFLFGALEHMREVAHALQRDQESAYLFALEASRAHGIVSAYVATGIISHASGMRCRAMISHYTRLI